jgi:hypothetical protein
MLHHIGGANVLKGTQVVSLVILSVVLWVAATLYIYFLPGALTSPVSGSMGFITTFPIAWLSVVLTRFVGKLSPDQLLAGVGVVGALAMMIDGIALRWFPMVYGSDPATLRLGAAWLLWGYGVSLGIAVLIAAQQHRKINLKLSRTS